MSANTMATRARSAGVSANAPASSLPTICFSTSDVPPRESEAYWREAISSKIGQIDVAPLHDEPIKANIVVQPLHGGLLMTEQTHSAQHLHRTRAQINRADEEFFILAMLHKGLYEFRQDGRAQAAGQAHGNLFFYNGMRETQMLTDDCAHTLIKVPTQQLRQVLPQIDDTPAQLFAPAHPALPVLQSLMGVLRTQGKQLQAPVGERMRDALLQTLAALVDTGAAKPKTDSSLELYHRTRINQFLQQHLSNTQLGPDMVAQATGLSKAHIHRLFAAHEASTLMQTVWQLRLARAQQMLKTPQHESLSVAQVAFKCGFSSAAHFSRMFKLAYGCTPLQWQREEQIPKP